MVAAAEELKELSAEAPAFSDVSLFSASAFGPEWPALSGNSSLRGGSGAGGFAAAAAAAAAAATREPSRAEPSRAAASPDRKSVV